MPAIVLTILGTAGKILLIILICLLVFLLLLLFYPVSYQADVRKQGDEILLKARVWWLLRFVFFTILMEKGEGGNHFEKELRIAGLPVLSLLEKRGKKKKKAVSAAAKRKNRIIRREATKKPTVRPGQKTAAAGTRRTLPVEVVKARHPGFLERLGARIASFFSKMKKQLKRIYSGADTAADWLDYFGSDSFGRVKEVLLKEGGAILRHVIPRKAEGTIRFGMDDPAKTGLVVGILYTLYPVFPEKLTIEPDFVDSCLEADVSAKGRIILGILIMRAVRIFLCREVRDLIRRVRSKEKRKRSDTKTGAIRKGRGRAWRKTKNPIHFRTT